VSNTERTLELFERSQAIFEDDLRQLEAERLVAAASFGPPMTLSNT
jgi:hypothetical protein